MSKPDVKNFSHILCFNCCAIFTAINYSVIKCPECGYCPDPDIYRKIMNYGIEAVYYGHDYRERYEKQLAEKGEIKTKYALPDPITILCFFAVAALSGIVGGFSYDIVKSAIRKVTGKANEINDDIGQTKIIFNSDNDIQVFIQQVKTFYLDLKDIEPSVKAEIKKEMIIWDLTEAVTPLIEAGKYTKEEIFKAFKKGLERTEHPQKPSKADFDKFWEQLEDDDS